MFPLSVRTAGVPGSKQAPQQPTKMSTSHYSRPYRATPPPPNTRRWTSAKLGTIGALLLVDMAALLGSQDIVESLFLAALVVVNCWALTRQ